MASAWLLTLPCSALVGAGAYALANAIGGSAGVIVDLLLLVALSGFIYWWSRSSKVDHSNVNAEWEGTVVPAEPSTRQRPE
jgi:PiT family inorganic phosphate transporter